MSPAGRPRSIRDDDSEVQNFACRPDNTERILMALVLKEAVKEYLPLKPKKEDSQAGRREARAWIFEPDQTTGKYVFGFEFICTYLGWDPDRVRERIRHLEAGAARSGLYREFGGSHNAYPPRRPRHKSNPGGQRRC